MREEKRPYFDRAVARLNGEPELALQLGLAMLVGMEEVGAMEAFAGAALHHTYHSHFPMPDGQFWQFSLAKGKPDAR